ncbi:hypothetical protein [Streptomyces sp. NPDC056242]|uniref:hypothetical protein n=1 Tax=Streptomyces sp. NPDC056242 TaxID=3345760 RepID=UPI0035D541CF
MSTPTTPDRPAPDPDFEDSIRRRLTETYDEYDLRLSIAEAQNSTKQGDKS